MKLAKVTLLAAMLAVTAIAAAAPADAAFWFCRMPPR